MSLSRTIVAALVGCATVSSALAQGAPGPLAPPPVPSENPITEAKRVLGKILFWDEQLSSDDSVACGSCHRPAEGGSDPRIAIHPGVDGLTPSPDDTLGSPGVARVDAQRCAVC